MVLIAEQQQMGGAQGRGGRLEPAGQGCRLAGGVAPQGRTLAEHPQRRIGLHPLGLGGLASGRTGDQQNRPTPKRPLPLKPEGVIETMVAIEHHQPRATSGGNNARPKPRPNQPQPNANKAKPEHTTTVPPKETTHQAR